MPARKPKGIDWNDNLADFKQAVLNTPQRAVKNAVNVAKSTPIGVAVQTANKGYSTFKNKGYKAAVAQQAQIAGIQLATEAAGLAAGKVAGKAIGAAATQINKLKPARELAIHFSHNPNLKVIKDIPAMRNKGANYGQVFDSTKFSPKGATYGYKIDKGSSGVQQIEAAMNEASNSYKAALAQGQQREYTLYVTRAKPLKGATKGIKDPEYGKEILAGDSGQTIYGKQKVVAKFPMTVEKFENVPLGTTGKSFTENIAAQDATKKQILDELYGKVSANKKVTSKGLKPHPLVNPFGVLGGAAPIKKTPRR